MSANESCPRNVNSGAEQDKGTPGKCPYKDIIKLTAPAVAENSLKITEDFYKRLFKNDPVTKKFFNEANMSKSSQQKALANAVCAYGANIDSLENLTGAVELIVNRHCALNVLPDHYPIVHRNFMESVAEVLQEAVTPEIGGAWSQAVLDLAGILVDKEKELYAKLESRRGGWQMTKAFRVERIEQVTPNCREFTFVAGGEPIDFTPGQYLTVHLPEVAPRHYTVTSKPGDPFLKCCVKRLEGGLVSNMMHKLTEGGEVHLSAPLGVFQADHVPTVLISAGIGVTPMKAFLQDLGENVKLAIHVDKNETEHPFLKDFKAVETHCVYTEGGRPCMHAILSKCMSLLDHQFLICGPNQFMEDAEATLKKAGATNIKMERFGPALA